MNPDGDCGYLRFACALLCAAMIEESVAARSAAFLRGKRIAASALMTIALLATGGLAFWRSSPGTDASSGYRAYLFSSDQPVLVVESGNRRPPATVTVATDGFLGTMAALPRDVAGRLVAAIGGDPKDIQLERLFSTQVNQDGSITATTVISLLGADGYSVALSTVSNGGTLTYLPPRRELPAEITPGAKWSSKGVVKFETPSMQRENRFTYLGSVEPAESREGRSCVLVLTALDQRSIDLEPYVRTVRSTWCTGKGSVESFVSETGTRSVVAAPGTVRLDPVAAPATQPLPLGAVLPSPFLSPDINIPPVVLGSLIISTSGSLGDLDAVRPVPDGQRVEWIQHPGGQILGLAADDSRLFVTTTSPALTAFDAAGRAHWLTRLPDAAVGSPLCTHGLVVTALLDGSLRAYDSATGEERWADQFDDVIASPPVVSGEQIIGGDVSGLVKALRLDGQTAWSRSFGSVRTPITALPDGGALVQDSTGMLHAVDAAGNLRWRSQLDVVVTGRGALLDGVVALPIGSGIAAIRLDDGSPAWRREGLRLAMVTREGWVAATTTSGRLTVDGKLLEQREISQPNLESGNAASRPSWPIVVAGQALVMQASGAITAVGHV